MLERYAFGFYDVVSALERARGRAEALESISNPADYVLQELRELLGRVREECGTLGLHSTADLAKQFEARYSADQPTSPSLFAPKHKYASIKNDLETLNASFRNELERELFVRLASGKESYFEPGKSKRSWRYPRSGGRRGARHGRVKTSRGGIVAAPACAAFLPTHPLATADC